MLSKSKYLRLLYKFLRLTFFFIIAGFMAISSFTTPVRTEPTVRNKDTGNYFLPDYGNTLIAAHRSGKGYAPENTLRAIQSCVAQRDCIDTIEMDVQTTKDGVLVLYHSLFLDENSNAEEYFGKKDITVFSKTYEELRQLNLGEFFKSGGKEPFAGLRGDEIPDDIRIVKLEDVLDYVETAAPGQFSYVIEIKYPYPWAPDMVDSLYEILSERNLTDRVIIGSFWNDVSHYIDNHYAGKLLRSANPAEIIDFYGCFRRGDDLSAEKFKYVALELPYYWDDGRLLLANLGTTELIDYAHTYGISVQYWTVEKQEDIRDLYIGGADMIMTNYPDRAAKVFKSTVLPGA